jgi:uncharacterized protein YoaH (UPF0181 family)
MEQLRELWERGWLRSLAVALSGNQAERIQPLINTNLETGKAVEQKATETTKRRAEETNSRERRTKDELRWPPIFMRR